VQCAPAGGHVKKTRKLQNLRAFIYQVWSARWPGWTFLSITGHEHLATVAGLHTHRFAKCRLARSKITARCSKISTWRSTFVTGTGKAVVESALALVAEAFACGRIFVGKTTPVRTKTTGAAAVKIATPRVMRPSTTVTATEIVRARVREALLRLHAGNGLGLELLVTVGTRCP